MSETLTVLDVCGRLRAECRKAGSQRAWAEKNGVTPQYVNSVLAAKQEPGPQMLAALGLRKVVRFVDMGTRPC